MELINSPLENKLIGTVITFIDQMPLFKLAFAPLIRTQKDFPQFSFIGIHSDKMGKKGMSSIL